MKKSHGSAAVMDGKLTGTTDTDYFYFLCPLCGGILRILDYEFQKDGPVEYARSLRRNAKRDFTIAFEIYCEVCDFHDIVKVSNTGWQGGYMKGANYNGYNSRN